MRRRIVTIIVVVATVVLAASVSFSQRGGDRGSHGVLGILSKGQAVSVKDVGGRYEIGVMLSLRDNRRSENAMPNVEMLGYKVVDVGQDYVVVEDITHVTELRIPIFSIKAVSVLKAPMTPQLPSVRE